MPSDTKTRHDLLMEYVARVIEYRSVGEWRRAYGVSVDYNLENRAFGLTVWDFGRQEYVWVQFLEALRPFVRVIDAHPPTESSTLWSLKVRDE